MLELILIVVLGITGAVSIDNVKDKSLDVMNNVSESVYSIHNLQGRGTGWITTAKSGKKVMVTNVHVCDSDLPVMFTEKDGKQYILPILGKDPSHDICVLAAPKNSVPLELADEVLENETAYSVGFPTIDFMSSQKGLIKGYSRLKMHYDGLPLDQCKGKKFKIETHDVEQRDGSIKAEKLCMFSAEAVVTTIQIDGGASGSPILNEDEEVIGMTMVRSGNINWAQGVPLKNLKAFLNKF